MCCMNRTEQVYLQHARPVRRLKVPKWKTKLSGADACAENDMVHLVEASCEGFHCFKIGNIACGDIIGVGFPIQGTNQASFRAKALGDGSSDAASGSDDGDRLVFEVKIHK